MDWLERSRVLQSDLLPVDFDEVPGFDQDDHLTAYNVFRQSCAFIAKNKASLRQAKSTSRAFKALCAIISEMPQPGSSRQALAFWKAHFAAHHVSGRLDPRGAGFVTGYYEPVVRGSYTRSEAFNEPIYGLPDNLVTIPLDHRANQTDTQISAGFIMGDKLRPYPVRAEIDEGAIAERGPVLLWLQDGIEVFMIQVQGSARIILDDDTQVRLVYAGRNGRPYTSIGKILIDRRDISAGDMSLESLKRWVRSAGQRPGDAGRKLMQQNQSYVFFRLDRDLDPRDGPIGGQGLSLTPMRSIAVDRNLWSYGLPFWIDANIPWQGKQTSKFSRLMIAQDTGSAIIGSARVDLFFGSGEAAGQRAGEIRHSANIFVLLPRDEV